MKQMPIDLQLKLERLQKLVEEAYPIVAELLDDINSDLGSACLMYGLEDDEVELIEAEADELSDWLVRAADLIEVEAN